jgi:SAM-dependent methyltransferase
MIVPSSKNGPLTCVRRWGRWSLAAGGFSQTSAYTATMWHRAFRRLPADTVANKVLILGLGLGNCLPIVKKRFPQAKVSFVEWDPVVIELARKIGYLKKSDALVIEGDAREVVAELKETYDLIIFDTYSGDRAMDAGNIFRDLAKILLPTGFLFVNGFHQPEIFHLAETFLEKENEWRFRFNRLALFHPVGWLAPKTAGYLPFRASSYYLSAEARAYSNREVIGENLNLGTRLHSGFRFYDQFISDDEPPLGAGPKRKIQWQRIARRDIPAGWRETNERFSPSMTGFVDLNDFDENNLNWSPHARRHLKHWREQSSKNWEVVDVSAEEFIQAYKKWRRDPFIVHFFLRHFNKQRIGHGENVKWFCLRRKDSGKIEAGFVALDIPELQQSIHLISFIYDSAKDDSVGVGLIYEWFNRSKCCGLRFADFDSFWVPGTFAAWRGFSRFKSQFGTRFVRYPRLLERRVK